MENFETEPKSTSAKTITEAIERIEKFGQDAGQDFQGILEKDFNEIKTHLQSLKPYLAKLQGNIESEVVRRKEQAESKLKENPWMVLGIVGFFAFVIGLFIAGGKKQNDSH